MFQPVKKAIIPAAGLGTRVLPATKAIPKEMLPIVDKPAIQYFVEEAVEAGIEEILIITSRGKSTMEDHFDASPLLEQKLAAGGESKADALRAVQHASNLAKITYLRQKEQLGLGHAVLQAKEFVGDEPFLVLYGDDVILSPKGNPVCGQLIRAYQQTGRGCVAMKQVTPQQISRYCSLKVDPIQDNWYNVTDMVEKPSTPQQIFSLFSILGRCLLPAKIFDILQNTPPGAGGEIQLTDAMAVLARTEGVTGVDFVGHRYDMGNKFGILQANIDVGLTHPETADQLREYIQNLAKNL